MNAKYNITKQGDVIYLSTKSIYRYENVPDNEVDSIIETISKKEPVNWTYDTKDPDFPVVLIYTDFALKLNFPDAIVVPVDSINDLNTEPLSNYKAAIDQARVICNDILLDRRIQSHESEPSESNVEYDNDGLADSEEGTEAVPEG